MNEYSHLPYMYQEDFKFCEYAKASALRIPLRDAINTARAMPVEKMEQVIEVLETALAHIRQETPDGEVYADASADPLDVLLGPAEDEPDAC